MINNKDLDLMDMIFNPFDWDKKFYKFNRDEKDMSPYSIINSGDAITMVHNVLGIKKEDLKLTKKIENRITYIIIDGKTVDEITGKQYSINSRFMVDETQLDIKKVTSTMKNGLLYITIPYKKRKEEPSEIILEIQ